MFPLLIGPLFDVVGKLFDKLIPDINARAAAKEQLLQQLTSQDFQSAMAQIAVNTEEAKSQSLFVAGWRPFVGWICGCAFGYNYILQPLFTYLLVALKIHAIGALPSVDIGTMLPVLMGMLGLGTLRTYEKVQGAGKGLS